MSIRIFSPEGFLVPDQELSSQKAQRERLVELARSGDKGDVAGIHAAEISGGEIERLRRSGAARHGS